MSKTLVIVESPAKCKTIEKYLGAGYRCMASCGHIRELDTDKGLACIDIAHGFRPLYRISSRKGDVIKRLREASQQCSQVVLATDDDREGEAIAWHLTQVLGLPLATTPRIIFHEITKPAIERAIASPKRVDMNRVLSQQARQVLDLLVGYSISPVLWKYIAHKDKPLSAGRCQSPALRLVFEKEEEIRDNPAKGVYTILGTFGVGRALDIPVQFTLTAKLPTAEEVEAFLEETVNHTHVFTRRPPAEKLCAPPEPLITTTLQRRAHSSLGLSSKETMDAAQLLYENGFITYMRTDSKALSDDFLKSAEEWITENMGSEYVGERVKRRGDAGGDADASAGGDAAASAATSSTKKIKRPAAAASAKAKNPKGAQEAHEAIRPTKLECLSINSDDGEAIKNKLSKREANLYRLIWTITAQSCCAPAKYSSIQSQISAPNDATYTREDRQPIFLGWMAVGGEGGRDGGRSDDVSKKPAPKRRKEPAGVAGEDAAESLDTTNPDIAVSSSAISTPYYATILATPTNTTVSYTIIKSQYGMANQTHRLCESSLISHLERLGIGRPSTYASIIDTLFKREYVRRGNVEGTTLEAIEHTLVDDTITESVAKKKAGAESGRLLIEPTGVLVMKLLIERFNALFSYDYTSHMEAQLDLVAKGELPWNKVCEEAYEEIERLIGGLKDLGAIKDNRQEIRLDDTHTYMIGRYGPVIRKLPPGASKKDKAEFIRVKPGIDPRDIEAGKLGLEDIADYSRPATTENMNTTGKCLGKVGGFDVVLKNGKYGAYIQWNGKNMNLKNIMRMKKLTMDTITLKDVEGILTEYDKMSKSQATPVASGAGAGADATTSAVPSASISSNIVRFISPTLSIRSGKYGNYIHFKKPTDERPTFFPLKAFKGDYLKCPLEELTAWVVDTHGIEL